MDGLLTHGGTFLWFLLDHFFAIPILFPKWSRELHAASSYLFWHFFPCRYLILRKLLPRHRALVGFLTFHVEFLLAQLAGWRRGGHSGCVCVCVPSPILSCYLFCWFVTAFRNAEYSLGLFSPFPHPSRPSFHPHLMKQHVNHVQANLSLEIKVPVLRKISVIPSLFSLRHLHSSCLADKLTEQRPSFEARNFFLLFYFLFHFWSGFNRKHSIPETIRASSYMHTLAKHSGRKNPIKTFVLLRTQHSH